MSPHKRKLSTGMWSRIQGSKVWWRFVFNLFTQVWFASYLNCIDMNNDIDVIEHEIFWNFIWLRKILILFWMGQYRFFLSNESLWYFPCIYIYIVFAIMKSKHAIIILIIYHKVLKRTCFILKNVTVVSTDQDVF